MKILVIGSGGREHALVWSIARSKNVDKIFCAPGNAGIARLAACVPIKADDIASLLDFVKKEKIDLTVVGPEAPLVAGIVDRFEKEGLRVFGPNRQAARLEASKSFAKEIMRKTRVPTAASYSCRTMAQVRDAVQQIGVPVVIKADGLAAGKGVVICESADSAYEVAASMLVDKIFQDAGETVVVEEFLRGEEASILVLTNGKTALPLASSQDHKRVFDHDSGPNTGGMGAYSPAPVVTSAVLDRIMKEIIAPVIQGMEKEGALYKGILYAGIMVTPSGPKVLEFNVRFGDPETQAVLARLESDLIEGMLWTIGAVEKTPVLKWSPKASVCVVIASGGYPNAYEKGKVIDGLDQAAACEDVIVFHAGTQQSPVPAPEPATGYYTDGGRVLGVTALGLDIKAAIDKAYGAVDLIHFDRMHYRKDIGWRALKIVDSP
jgi:phosphoribosylamine--glycine ligase